MSQYRLDKHVERRIAKMLGGERTGHLGGADVIAGHIACEVKSRGQLPQWLTEAIEQAEQHAGERLPLAVLHQAGDRYMDALVVVRMSDFLDWYGGA